MSTIYAEATLAQQYKTTKDGEVTGGPVYYIRAAFKGTFGKVLAGIFAVLIIIALGFTGNMVQSNSIGSAFYEVFNARGIKIPQIVFGLILAAITAFIFIGGVSRLASVVEKLVPLMAGIYITAVLHSSAQVDHPARQGFYGIVEVFVDTLLICSTTGFTVLVTGVNQVHDNAATLTAAAFESVFPGMQYVTYISLLLFAGTSIMSQWYFGHISLTFLKKTKWANVYRVIFPFLIILGSMSTINMVWSIQDVALGLLIIPKIIALIFLAPEVRKMTKEFLDPKNGYIAPGRGSEKKK